MLLLILAGPHAVDQAPSGQWRIASNASGPREVVVERLPFVIGRSPDCQLVLPEAPDLRAVTSRWHCHLTHNDGKVHVVDGGLQEGSGPPSPRVGPPGPGSGPPKASITGTRVNGRNISGPTLLKLGDVLEVGPWRFAVSERPTASATPDGGGILDDVVRGERRKVDSADPRLKEKFGQLHELVRRLAETPDLEESLAALLSYVTGKIPAAEVAAILLTDGAGRFSLRLAWEKSLGKARDFKVSEALLASLPAQESFFLQSKLKDRSASQSLHDISSGLLLPLWGKGDRIGVFYLDNRRTGNTFTDEDLYLASAIASLASLQLALEKQAQLSRIEENMARYFAPDVVQRIVALSALSGKAGLEVQEREVSVLFVDMEGFTAMSRSKTPKEISELLSPYFEAVARVIQAEGGHVNKFIGDAVMGIFGAQPGESEGSQVRHAEQAIRAALAIPAAWAQEARRLRLPPMRLRVGVNSGRAVVGNIGYSARLEYSVLGDSVNIASRLEKLAPAGGCLVSEATRKLAEEAFEFEDHGVREVRGIGMLATFIPVGPKPPGGR